MPQWSKTHLSFLPLNFTDWDMLVQHRRWLPKHVSGLLDSIDYRIDEWPQRFAREKHQYRENASLIAMSEFEKAAEFCRCCTIGSGRGKFQHGKCLVWKLCPYCSHKKRQVILRKFLPVFQRGHWWFLTISPAEMCNVNSCTVDCLVGWWEACRYALHKLKDEGLIKGAFTLETLSIHQYWPYAKGLPHDHVVLLADTMTPPVIDELKRQVASYHGQEWNSKKHRWIEPDSPEALWAVPSTRTYDIQHEYDFASILSYVCNPINLAAAYIRDWPQVSGNDQQVAKFNENAIEAINAWCLAVEGRWGHRYLGALQHAHSGFTGIKKAKRETKSHERLVKAMLDECPLARMLDFDPDDLGEPVEFMDAPPAAQ